MRLRELELLLLVKLECTLIVLEDCSIEVFLELLAILAVHNDAVLGLTDLLLRLHTVLLLLSESIGSYYLLRINEAHPLSASCRDI